MAETLSKLECREYNTSKDFYIRFYDKLDLPKRLHYANNHRIEDVIIEVADKWKVFRCVRVAGGRFKRGL